MYYFKGEVQMATRAAPLLNSLYHDYQTGLMSCEKKKWLLLGF